jgi:hypothetical protein
MDLHALDDGALRTLIAAALEEQRRRAAAQGGLEELCEQGFIDGFDQRGHARPPVVVGDVLFCYGSIVERSAMSHECVFVRVEDAWVWEYEDVLRDEVRKRPERGREHQRSVSLVPALEGLEFDLVQCKMRNGVHQMQHTRSYRITSGSVELVTTRSVKTDRAR